MAVLGGVNTEQNVNSVHVAKSEIELLETEAPPSFMQTCKLGTDTTCVRQWRSFMKSDCKKFLEEEEWEEVE